MIKGVDYIGVVVSFYCHDGQGNYVIHKRSSACRDEHDTWDFGGGGLRFNELLEQGLKREVKEEYGVEILEVEFMGFDEILRTHEGVPTHWISFDYRVLVDRSKVVNAEPEKHSEIQWVTINDLPSPLHSQQPRLLEKYKDKL